MSDRANASQEEPAAGQSWGLQQQPISISRTTNVIKEKKKTETTEHQRENWEYVYEIYICIYTQILNMWKKSLCKHQGSRGVRGGAPRATVCLLAGLVIPGRDPRWSNLWQGLYRGEEVENSEVQSRREGMEGRIFTFTSHCHTLVW